MPGRSLCTWQKLPLEGPRGARERAPIYVYCEPKDNDEVSHQQRERAPVCVQNEPKDNDEVAHQQLPSDFALSFKERMA